MLPFLVEARPGRRLDFSRTFTVGNKENEIFGMPTPSEIERLKPFSRRSSRECFREARGHKYGCPQNYFGYPPERNTGLCQEKLFVRARNNLEKSEYSEADMAH